MVGIVVFEGVIIGNLKIVVVDKWLFFIVEGVEGVCVDCCGEGEKGCWEFYGEGWLLVENRENVGEDDGLVIIGFCCCGILMVELMVDFVCEN